MITRGRPAHVSRWVNPRIPIPVFQTEGDPEPKQRPAPEPDVGTRWGRPADLAFALPPSNLDNGDNQQDLPPSLVVEDAVEERLFVGNGVEHATDHLGRIIASSPPFDKHDNPFLIRTIYFCGTFTEKSEEKKTLPTGVEVITPVETHIRQYVQWDSVPDWVDLKYDLGTTLDETPVPPGGHPPQRCGPTIIGPGG